VQCAPSSAFKPVSHSAAVMSSVKRLSKRRSHGSSVECLCGALADEGVADCGGGEEEEAGDGIQNTGDDTASDSARARVGEAAAAAAAVVVVVVAVVVVVVRGERCCGGGEGEGGAATGERVGAGEAGSRSCNTHTHTPQQKTRECGTTMQKLRFVILRFGTARQKMVLE
jgi:hypothetical protein